MNRLLQDVVGIFKIADHAENKGVNPHLLLHQQVQKLIWFYLVIFIHYLPYQIFDPSSSSAQKNQNLDRKENKKRNFFKKSL